MPMTDQIREQMSALLDGELPQDQIGLLVRRMERDSELRRAFGSYVLVGETLRAPGGRTASRGFASRVQAVIDAGDAALPAVLDERSTRRASWTRPAAATAIAAGAAFAAVLLMRPGDRQGAVELASVEATAPTVPAIADAIAELSPPDSASPTPAQSQRLAGYLVAHSQFASPIGRRTVWSSVLAQDPGIARVAYETAEGP
jgi:sigma-E factor negative regulatory protein RseA